MGWQSWNGRVAFGSLWRWLPLPPWLLLIACDHSLQGLDILSARCMFLHLAICCPYHASGLSVQAHWIDVLLS